MDDKFLQLTVITNYDDFVHYKSNKEKFSFSYKNSFIRACDIRFIETIEDRADICAVPYHGMSLIVYESAASLLNRLGMRAVLGPKLVNDE